MREKDKIKKIS